jgi:hypothetical protein
MLLFSFDLFTREGTLALSMRDNMFTWNPIELYDLQVSTIGKEIYVRRERRHVILNMTYERIPFEKLQELVAADQIVRNTRSEKKMNKLRRRSDFWRNLPPDPPHQDNVTPEVATWAFNNCLDDEVMVPFLDIKNLLTWVANRPLHIRNGFTSRGLVIDAGIVRGSGAILNIRTSPQ